MRPERACYHRTVCCKYHVSEMKILGPCAVKTVLKVLIVSIFLVAFYSTLLLFSAKSLPYTELAQTQGFEQVNKTKLSVRVTFWHRLPRQFFLKQPVSMSSYTSKTGRTTCLNVGTRYTTHDECKCRDGWNGRSCSIPDSLYHSYSMTSAEKRRLHLRKRTARRIIYAAMFNHEFDMLEALLNEHYDVVDAFIFLESTYTAFGTRKPLRLLPKLHHGYLKEFHSKIMYLYCDHFPIGGRKKGWKADSYFRAFLGKHSLTNIHNLRDDDLFLVFDIDEIPSLDTLAFFKCHDGYPEPFGVRLRWSVFGFFLKNRRYSQTTIGCTVGMLKNVYLNDSNIIRDIEHGLDPKFYPYLKVYKKKHRVRAWFMGEDKYYAGWHCSGCFHPEGIRIKFTSAQNADYPRWGSIPKKMDLNYIESLIREGKWFDGEPISQSDLESDNFYAPQHFIRNPDMYRHLLYNPY